MHGIGHGRVGGGGKALSLNSLSLSPSLFFFFPLLTLGRKGLRGMERQEVIHQAAGYCDLCDATCIQKRAGGGRRTLADGARLL